MKRKPTDLFLKIFLLQQVNPSKKKKTKQLNATTYCKHSKKAPFLQYIRKSTVL